MLRTRQFVSYSLAFAFGIAVALAGVSQYYYEAIPNELRPTDAPTKMRTELLGSGGDFQILRLDLPEGPFSSQVLWDKRSGYTAFELRERPGSSTVERFLYLPGANPRWVAHVVMDLDGNPINLMCCTGTAAVKSNRPEEVAYDMNLDGRFELLTSRDENGLRTWFRTSEGWIPGTRDQGIDYLLVDGERRPIVLGRNGYWERQ